MDSIFITRRILQGGIIGTGIILALNIGLIVPFAMTWLASNGYV